MKSDELLLLTPREIQNLLTLEECIPAVEHAFRVYGEGKATPPAVLSMHVEGGGFHVKAGMLELRRSYFAAKVNGNFPQNMARFGLPTIQGVIVLCDAQQGSPLAVMDSRFITAVRTGAATAVAAKYLARKDAHTATICGCGNQGRVQLQALSRVVLLDRVFVYDQQPGASSALAQELTADLKIPVTSVDDLHAAVRRSDICVTCTSSSEPFLGPEDVRPGTFVAAVGADHPHKQELHPNLMARSKIVCDVFEQCAAMGDLHHALEAGAISRSEVHAELGEVVAGKKPGRESDDETIIFDSTGMALQDVAAAAFVYEKAERQGSGVRLNFAA
jgi:alanine dehydrogenase